MQLKCLSKLESLIEELHPAYVILVDNFIQLFDENKVLIITDKTLDWRWLVPSINVIKAMYPYYPTNIIDGDYPIYSGYYELCCNELAAIIKDHLRRNNGFNSDEFPLLREQVLRISEMFGNHLEFRMSNGKLMIKTNSRVLLSCWSDAFRIINAPIN